jgi:hypothetical protein
MHARHTTMRCHYEDCNSLLTILRIADMEKAALNSKR